MKGPMCFALCLLGLMSMASASDWFEGETCIDITKAPACKGKPVGDHHICNFCQHGFFARCQEDSEEVTIIACPHIENGEGEYFRLIFDDESKTCEEKTPTCTTAPRRRRNSNWM